MTFPSEVAREDRAKPAMWIVRLLSLGDTVWHVDRAHLQTMMFLRLVAGGHLMLLLTRTPRAFWKPPLPAPQTVLGHRGTQVFAVFMCAFGWGVPSLPWIIIGFVWAYNLVLMIVQELVELSIYRELNSRAKNRTLFLKHLKAVVRPHGTLHQH